MNTNSSPVNRLCRRYIALALVLTSCLLAASTKSQTVTNILYQDIFSGSPGDPLQGRLPDTVNAYGPGTNTWIADGWVLDGSGNAVEQVGLRNAFLPFVPLPGRVYTFSVGLHCANGAWVAMGFTASASTSAYFAGSLNAVGWQLCNSSAGTGPGTQQTFMGPNTLRQGTPTVTYADPFGTYTTILDTRPTSPANWTFTFLINGTVAIPAQAFGGTGPTINFVGIGSGNASDTDYVQNFMLTEQVATQPPTISVQPQPPTVGTNFPGDTVKLSVVAGGYPGPFYQWRVNATNISGATGSGLVLANLGFTNAGSYTVVVSSAGLSVTSTPVTIALTTPLTNSIYRDTFSGVTGPLDGRVPDTAGGTNLWIASNFWTAGNDGTTNLATASGDPSGPNAFLPFIPTPGQVYVLSAVLDDQAGGNTWIALGYSGAAPTGGGFNRGTTVGWMLARDDGDAEANQAFIGPGTASGANLDNFSTGPATYTAILDTRPALPANWTFSFQVNGATVRPPTAFGGSGPSITYVGMGVANGNNDFVTAQNFTLTALSLPVKPYFVTAPQGGTYYVGQSVTISSTVGGAVPLTYQWQRNSNNIPGATTSSLVVSNLVVTNTASYRLIVSNPVGSSTSSPALLIVSTAPSAVTLSSNLVLHLTFDTNYLDTSGRGNNATNVGSSIVPGIIGGAMTYGNDGSTHDLGYITLGSPSDLLFSNNVNFSVSYWIQYPDIADNQTVFPSFPNGDQPVIGNAVGSTYQPGWVISQGSGTFVWTINDTSASVVVASGPANSENDGNWHHLAHIFDWSQGYGITYLDGVKVDATSIVGLNTIDRPNPIIIGEDPTGAYFSPAAANLDDLAIWRRTLSGDEVRSIYEAGVSNHVSVASLPLPLVAKIVSGQLQVTWSVGILQQSSSLTGPWATVTNAITPSFTVPVTAAQRFYRAIQ